MEVIESKSIMLSKMFLIKIIKIIYRSKLITILFILLIHVTHLKK